MKKRIVNIVIVGICLILTGTAFVYATPHNNINKLWGKILSEDHSAEEKVKKGQKYKLALNGIYSEKSENIDEIVEEGSSVLITKSEVQKARDFYKMNGDSEQDAQKKAINYVEEENAMYAEAIKNGYNVTDEEVDKYIEELKNTVSIANNKDAVDEVINSFDSEDEYWEYEHELYKKLLPVQKYVKDLETNFIEKNRAKMEGDEINTEWNKKFQEIKDDAVKKQAFKAVNSYTDISKKFLAE